MTKRMCPKIKRPPPKKAQARHTHATAAGIEDAIAVLLYAQQDLEIIALRVAQAMQVLQKVRGGPHAYDPEKPAAKLIIRRLR